MMHKHTKITHLSYALPFASAPIRLTSSQGHVTTQRRVKQSDWLSMYYVTLWHRRILHEVWMFLQLRQVH